MPTRTNRLASLARWQQAGERARAEGIRVMQVRGTGQWIATSGTRQDLAYALEVIGEIAHACECKAAEHEDPVCKHRAAFYLHIGTLSLPERECFWCHGTGRVPNEYTQEFIDCDSCAGTGRVTRRDATPDSRGAEERRPRRIA